MNIPKVIADLVKAQNDFDSVAYADCFSQTAVVFDDGETHHGKKEIEHWIAAANEKYKAVMNPISFEEKDGILKTEVSGDFPGSPVILSYHFEIGDELIQSLKVTG